MYKHPSQTPDENCLPSNKSPLSRQLATLPSHHAPRGSSKVPKIRPFTSCASRVFRASLCVRPIQWTASFLVALGSSAVTRLGPRAAGDQPDARPAGLGCVPVARRCHRRCLAPFLELCKLRVRIQLFLVLGLEELLLGLLATGSRQRIA